MRQRIIPTDNNRVTDDLFIHMECFGNKGYWKKVKGQTVDTEDFNELDVFAHNPDRIFDLEPSFDPKRGISLSCGLTGGAIVHGKNLEDAIENLHQSKVQILQLIGINKLERFIAERGISPRYGGGGEIRP